CLIRKCYTEPSSTQNIVYRIIYEKYGYFLSATIGMIFGCLGGGIFFYHLDVTKGWNPYGWWFLATFLSTVFFGIVGILVFNFCKNKFNQ
ncbi:hypothetical protein KA005_19060, partial [bacterium]|nr:hypothetical protein [bacterium]